MGRKEAEREGSGESRMDRVWRERNWEERERRMRRGGRHCSREGSRLRMAERAWILAGEEREE